MKKTVSLLFIVFILFAVNVSSASALWGASGWEKSYYLDPFGDTMEDYYIGTTERATGSFKSSSVTEGTLEAELRVDFDRVCILLYENGNDQVRNSEHRAIAFSILMKAADGTKTQLYGEMESGGDCVIIEENQTRSILHFADVSQRENPVTKALCAEKGEVSFYLTRDDQPATSYLFTVKTGNFATLYETEIVSPIQEAAYAKAEALRVGNNYDGAITCFTALGDYKDSAARAEEANAAKIEAKRAEQYAQAEALLESKDYDGAIQLFTALGDYRDSATRLEKAREAKNADAYVKAQILFANYQFDAAIVILQQLDNYKDAKQLLQQSVSLLDSEKLYQKALGLVQSQSSEDQELAYCIFAGLDGYRDSSSMVSCFSELLGAEEWVFSNGIPNQIIHFSYDSAGRLVSKNENDGAYVYFYLYDEEGYLLSETEKFSPDNTITTEFNKNGYPKTVTHVGKHAIGFYGEFINATHETYDYELTSGMGLTAYRNVYNGVGLTASATIDYDSRGEITHCSFENRDSKTHGEYSFINEYDEQGRVISTQEYRDTDRYSETCYEYNSDGTLSTKLLSYPNGNTVEIRFTYSHFFVPEMISNISQ